MRSPYFFGTSLAAIHLRASMRIAALNLFFSSHPNAQIRQGAELNATFRLGAGGETGDFKGLTLSNSKPRPLKKPGHFFWADIASISRVSAPTRLLMRWAGTCHLRCCREAQMTNSSTNEVGLPPVRYTERQRKPRACRGSSDLTGRNA
jgi:hypothetical protein